MGNPLTIRFHLEGGATPSIVNVRTVEDQGDGTQVDQQVTGDLHLVGPTTVVAYPLDTGYWTVVQRVTQNTDITFPRIRPPGRYGWWHELHGVADDHSTGRGIRIGVIDEALELQGPSSCIRHVKNLAASAWSSNNPRRALQPMVSHSKAVCSLLASRPVDGQGVAGVAPGADIYFAAAGEDGSSALDPTRLANAIDMLVEEYDCHLITVSAGDSEQPTEEILFRVQNARERGSLCLFAAGNRGGEPLYPARYPECLAVGACGRSGTAPGGTYLHLLEQNPAAEGDDGLFLWNSSAHGKHVELLAAGVGTVWCIDGRVAFAACGTSYASPVATGVLAVILSNDPGYLECRRTGERSRRALSALRDRCLARGFDGAVAYGIPIAQGGGGC